MAGIAKAYMIIIIAIKFSKYQFAFFGAFLLLKAVACLRSSAFSSSTSDGTSSSLLGNNNKPTSVSPENIKSNQQLE